MDGREKLIKIMQTEGLNAKQFAAEVGIQAGTISNILNGRNNASNDVVQKVLRRFENISADWMMLDRGPMYRPVPAAPVGEQTTPTLFDSLPAEPAMVSPTPEQQQPAGTTAATVSASPVASPTAPPVITTTAATSLPERTTALPGRTPATTTNTDTANAPQHTTQPANRQEPTIGQNNHNNTPPAKQIEKIVVFYSDGTYEDFCH